MTNKKDRLSHPIGDKQVPRHTSEMQEIIGKPPPWLLRWGISVFFAVLLLLVAMTKFVKYPDLVKARLTLLSGSPGSRWPLHAELQVLQQDFSKIKKGQQVLVKLKSYPAEEYGLLRGHITSIDHAPSVNGTFPAVVEITGKGISEFKEPGKLRTGLEADAQIITENKSIGERVLKSLFKKTRPPAEIN